MTGQDKAACPACFGARWECRRCIEDILGTGKSIGCSVGHGGPWCRVCGGTGLADLSTRDNTDSPVSP